MLVCSRMVYDLRLVPAHDLIHPVIVPDRGNQRYKIQTVPILHFQLLLNIIGIIFVNIHNDNLPGLIPCNLAHQLRADGPAAAGNHTDLSADECPDILIVELNGLPSQQILHPDVMDLAQQAAFLKDQLADKGHNLHRKIGLCTDIQNALPFILQTGGNSKNNLLNLQLFRILEEFIRGANHRHIPDHTADLGCIIVNNAYRLKGSITGCLTRPGIENLPDQHVRCLSGTNDHRALVSGLSPSAGSQFNKCLFEYVPEQADTDHDHQRM